MLMTLGRRGRRGRLRHAKGIGSSVGLTSVAKVRLTGAPGRPIMVCLRQEDWKTELVASKMYWVVGMSVILKQEWMPSKTVWLNSAYLIKYSTIPRRQSSGAPMLRASGAESKRGGPGIREELGNGKEPLAGVEMAEQMQVATRQKTTVPLIILKRKSIWPSMK